MRIGAVVSRGLLVFVFMVLFIFLWMPLLLPLPLWMPLRLRLWRLLELEEDDDVLVLEGEGVDAGEGGTDLAEGVEDAFALRGLAVGLHIRSDPIRE